MTATPTTQPSPESLLHAIASVASIEAPSRATRARIASQASIAAPVAGLAAGAWLTLRGHKALGLGAAGAALAFGLARWQLARFFTEEAAYEVELRDGPLEIRRYAATVRAETVVEGAEWGQALDEGFRRIARYIFGDNASEARVAMTSPVVASLPEAQEPSPSERVTLNAPLVTTFERATGRADRTVAFIMPSDRSLSTLPAPHDARVRLREAPPQRVAALRFHGAYDGSLPAEKREELLRRVKSAALTPVGEVAFAGYDPPSTLPRLRRNEVFVEVI